MCYPPLRVADSQQVEEPKPRATKKDRNSNLELYRIIVMLLIVAHHYVVNSGLVQVLIESPFSASSAGMLLFGAWGKTGINCFVLITGYFMCTSQITGRKLFKLYLQITLYAVIIYGIFSITGHETFSYKQLVWKLNPITSISSNFICCFLIFYLLIPFLNIFVRSLTEKQHLYLICVLLFFFTILPTFTRIDFSMNYVEWFVILYFIAAYLRFYGSRMKIKHAQWGWLSLLSILLGCLSVIGPYYLKSIGIIHGKLHYYLLADSNKPIALAVAVTTFMWFKDLRISHSKIINTLGAATFGVLLIHANSNAMRQWLWQETADCVGHQTESVFITVGYAVGVVVTVFLVCAFIDFLRGVLIEPWMMRGAKKISMPRFVKCFFNEKDTSAGRV